MLVEPLDLVFGVGESGVSSSSFNLFSLNNERWVLLRLVGVVDDRAKASFFWAGEVAALAISANLRRCFRARADSTSGSVSSSEDEVVDDCSSGDGGSFADDAVSVSPESYCNSLGSLVQVSDDAIERV